MPKTKTQPNIRPRVRQLDIARSFALVAMAVYHFNYDLAMFGLIAPETLQGTALWLLARVTASSFLLLVGISLFLAHGQRIRWPAFWRRLGILIVAASLVSAGTYYAMGDYWVRFGILHSIAASSLIGLAFLRLPAALTLCCAVACFFAPQIIGPDTITAPWLLWLFPVAGRPAMVDYLPVLPWLTPVLVGIAGAKLAAGSRALAAVGTARQPDRRCQLADLARSTQPSCLSDPPARADLPRLGLCPAFRLSPSRLHFPPPDLI